MASEKIGAPVCPSCKRSNGISVETSSVVEWRNGAWRYWSTPKPDVQSQWRVYGCGCGHLWSGLHELSPEGAKNLIACEMESICRAQIDMVYMWLYYERIYSSDLPSSVAKITDNIDAISMRLKAHAAITKNST